MDILHNISIHIYSVEMHDLTVDTHTLSPLPYHIIWHKYDAHVVSLYFYMFHICDLFFPRPSVLTILALIFEFFKYQSHHDINEGYLLFSDIQHSQPHMTLYRATIFKVEVAIVNLVYNH